MRDREKQDKCAHNNCKLYVLKYNYCKNDLQEIITNIKSLYCTI